MAKEKPQGAVDIGHSLYLFKSHTNSVDCIISAHGGYVSANRSFTVPSGIKIIFYGPHGAALLDPTITSFLRNQGEAEPVEIFEGGDDCRNYLLSKYQGAHAGESGKEVVETYSQINQGVSTRDKVRANKFDILMKSSTVKEPDAKRAKLAMEQIEHTRGGSVLTVRNRWHTFLGVPLKDAIGAARKAYPALREFHCLFCRSYMLGDDPLPSQGVNFKPKRN